MENINTSGIDTSTSNPLVSNIEQQTAIIKPIPKRKSNSLMLILILILVVLLGVITYLILSDEKKLPSFTNKEDKDDDDIVLEDKQSDLYPSSRLLRFFEIPGLWTVVPYTKELNYIDRGLQPHMYCLPNSCIFFENKELIDNSNSTAYQAVTDDGRAYGYISTVSISDLFDEESKDITPANFYEAIDKQYPEEKPSVDPIEGGGPGGFTTEKAKKVVVSKYEAVLVTTHPTWGYEGSRPQQKSERYFILLEDDTVLLIYFEYDETYNNIEQEKIKFQNLLSSITIE